MQAGITIAGMLAMAANLLARRGQPLRRLLVWDLVPLRLSHGPMVPGFAVAWITPEEDRRRRAHAVLGYTPQRGELPWLGVEA